MAIPMNKNMQSLALNLEGEKTINPWLTLECRVYILLTLQRQKWVNFDI